jgi:hypothetical protein
MSRHGKVRHALLDMGHVLRNLASRPTHVVPEVAIILVEQIMGPSVVDGIGLYHADPSVAQQDVQTMASFHGVHSRVAGFVSPPAAHIQVSLPMNGFLDVKSTSGSTQRMIHHPGQSPNFAKNVKLLKIKEPSPTLPRCRYQISWHRWIPTDDPNGLVAIVAC